MTPRHFVAVMILATSIAVDAAAAGMAGPPRPVSPSAGAASGRASVPGAPRARGARGADPAYEASIQAWRKEQETHLRADDGWLSVAGLFWLKDGANHFGADPSNEIVLPAGSAPARAGVFEFHDGKTMVEMEPGVVATIETKPVTKTEMRPDASGSPDVLSLKALRMFVIKRGDRYGIRLKDNNRPERLGFAGRTWFPSNEAYRVTAAFVPYQPPRKIPVANVLGQTEQMTCPGYASFTLGGRTLRLEPLLEDPDATELFYIFRDATSGKETYGAGRFLYSDLPKDGKVVLDFNKAYSPPCAFTPYATCPLPPRQNHLPVRVEAGETSSGHH